MEGKPQRSVEESERIADEIGRLEASDLEFERQERALGATRRRLQSAINALRAKIGLPPR